MLPNQSFGNLDNVEESSYEAIPAGVYTLRAIDIELKATKTGTGQYLQVQMEVMDGPKQNHKFYVRFNLINQNQTAVDIALRDVKSWLKSCGHSDAGELTMDRLTALEGLAFQAKVKVTKDKSGQYDDSNEIARFLPQAGSAQAGIAPVASSGVLQSNDSAAMQKKPWE